MGSRTSAETLNPLPPDPACHQLSAIPRLHSRSRRSRAGSFRCRCCGLVRRVQGRSVPSLLHTVTLFSEGTKRTIAAMNGAGVSRLAVITGVGAGESRGHGGRLYEWIGLPFVIGAIYADKDRQEALVKASDLDWTIVRPTLLTNGPRTGHQYRVSDELRPLSQIIGPTAKICALSRRACRVRSEHDEPNRCLRFAILVAVCHFLVLPL